MELARRLEYQTHHYLLTVDVWSISRELPPVTRKTSLQRGLTASLEYESSYRLSAFLLQESRKSRSSSIRLIPACKAAGLSSQRIPVFPSKTISCSAPLRKQTVGTPKAIASTTLRPNDS